MTRLCAIFVMLVFCGIYLLTPRALAESDWFDNSLEIKQLKALSSATDIPNSTNCLPDTKFVLTPQRLGASETSITGCAVRTTYGFVNGSSGHVRLHDSILAGTVKNVNGSKLSVTPIPNSPHMLYVNGGYNGSFTYLIRDFAQNIKTVVDYNGTIYHQLKPDVVITPLKDSSGTTLDIYSRQLSDNGKWMVAEIPWRGLTRINLETGEILTFGGVYNHWNGLRPHFLTAISGDGRYILSAESRYEVLKLYDLSSCTPVSDQVQKYTCRSRDILPTMRSLLPSFRNVHHAQFSTNSSIRLYMSSTPIAGQNHFGYYLMASAGQAESLLDYLALGDSFASGEGAHAYKAATDIRNPLNKCHLSTLSYPYLLHSMQSLNSVESVACSGAKLKDIYPSGSSGDYRQYDRQSHGKESLTFDSAIYNNYLVGYRPQLDFVERTKPKQITVSISGNDIGFGTILRTCLMPGTCFNTPQDRLNLSHTISSKRDEIAATYHQIKNKAGSDAKIYALGYPSLADPDGNCALNVHLNRDEIILSNQLIQQLNDTIRQAAQQAQVTYINVERAFAGHRLCETKSSNVAVNGLTAGDDKTLTIPIKHTDYIIDLYLTGRESYHPNKLGHKLYAAAINNAIQSPNALQGRPLNLTAGTSSTLSPRTLIFTNVTDELITKGKSATLQFSRLLPNREVTIYLDSLPLKTITVPATGTLSTELVLPSETPYGFHTLRIPAKSQQGEDITIQQLIYFAASEDDLDGDGILNQNEACLATDPSLVDYDEDGVDDACDIVISEKPPAIHSVNSPQSASLTSVTPHVVKPLSVQSIPINTTRIIVRQIENAKRVTLHAKTVQLPENTQNITSRTTPRLSYKWLPVVVVVIISGLVAWRRRHRKGTIYSS